MTDLNPNSAAYWYSATEHVAKEYPVNVPGTKIVPFEFMNALSFLDGEKPAPNEFPYGELDTAACELGWPMFIRSDLSSAKHDGIRAVQARDADEVEQVAASIVRDAAMKSMHPGAFVLREWIDIDSRFQAFDGLPIGTEFRVFATPDEHLCTHYYWPEDSIKQANEPETVWKRQRDELEQVRRPYWMESAARAAAFEADFQHGVDDPSRAWSVDFARDEDGEWWLIDMALAEESWHPECEAESEVSANA